MNLLVSQFNKVKKFILADFDLKSYLFIALYLIPAIILNYYFEPYKLLSKSDLWVGNILIYHLLLYSLHTIIIIAILKRKDFTDFWKGSFLLLIVTIVFGLATKSYIVKAEYISGFSNHIYFNYKLTNQLSVFLGYLILVLILGVWYGRSKFNLYGLLSYKRELKLYLYLFLLTIPLLLIAGSTNDFLNSYPKLNISRFKTEEFLSYFTIYEPFYLINFIGIEWFFRGFLVLFFSKYFGRHSVIIMASFYCIFHFGKPMAECISSFFGGYILGVISYNTRSIWGGVFIHMGIAFSMDLIAIGYHYLLS
jgi:hypothetical protein